MTEEEAKKQLFKLHQEYMSHTPVERLELYSEYQRKREIIKEELAKYVSTQLEMGAKRI